MQTSQITTLFAECPAGRREPSAFLVSTVLHAVVIGSLYLGLKHTVKVSDEAAIRRYSVRLLSLVRPRPPLRRPVESQTTQAASGEANAVAAAGPAPAPPLLEAKANLMQAKQTIVQPDLPHNLLLPQEVPVPLVLMWSPTSSANRTILPPPPQERAMPTVRPDLTAPNRELELASIKVSASPLVTDLPAPSPSTTSPVAKPGPEPVKQMAETGSKPLGPPTPARVLLLSDLHLDSGTIALPAVNETAAVGAPNAVVPVSPVNTTGEANGNATGKQRGNGNSEAQQSEPRTGAGSEQAAVARTATTAGTGDSPMAGDAGAQPAVTRIVMPKDGKFGVVVVGSSMAEEYPETVGLWGNRMAYTVYLHVGLTKNWILQYSLPAANDQGAAGHIDAPWPYVMERPQLAPGDLEGDAILVHGFVNADGRFEKLAIAFPADFAQAKFVLAALDGWRFRAAMKNGLFTTVEVLLIIPAEAE